MENNYYFESYNELFKYLLYGGKIRVDSWRKECYVYLKDNIFIDENGLEYKMDINNISNICKYRIEFVKVNIVEYYNKSLNKIETCTEEYWDNHNYENNEFIELLDKFVVNLPKNY